MTTDTSSSPMGFVSAMGVDPGLVHTGIVALQLYSINKTFLVDHQVVDGVDEPALEELAAFQSTHMPYKELSFVEAYRPRSAYDSDARMGKAVNDIAAMGFKPINNTGVKKAVRVDLMKLLNLWTFSTPTHHQDLRSAAYIMIYGLLKNPRTNKVLADFVSDHVAGRTWQRINP